MNTNYDKIDTMFMIIVHSKFMIIQKIHYSLQFLVLNSVDDLSFSWIEAVQ